MLLWSLVEFFHKLLGNQQWALPTYSYLFLLVEEVYPTIANIGTRVFKKSGLAHGSRRWYGLFEFLFERALSFVLPMLGYLYCDQAFPALIVFASYFAFNSIYFLLAICGFRYVDYSYRRSEC